MTPEYEKRLEATIDRELKALPVLRAPDTLATRVMGGLAQRDALPWYCRAWTTWPRTLQVASLVFLLAAFAGICVGSWALLHTPVVASALSEVGGWFGGLGAAWRTAGVLVNAIAVAFKSLGTWVIVGCGLALLFGYATCVGLGTVYVRLAFARR